MNLRSTTEFLQAVDYHLAAPRNGDLAKYKLSDLEWEVLQDIEVTLEVSFRYILNLLFIVTRRRYHLLLS